MAAKLLLIVVLANTWILPQQWLFKALETLTGTPWEYTAAFNQFEKNVRKNNGRDTNTWKIPSHLWAGQTNPNPQDTHPESIHLFQGLGQDGNGDGKADPQNEFDRLYSIAKYLSLNGHTQEAIRKQIWEYYHHPTTVDVITHMAQIIRKYEQNNLDEFAFPLPQGYNYTLRGTWGDRRGWGGLRIHEGTDIFADYGTPVRSTCYGYVELIGWNRYGGWRIGIRDLKNRYHYYAHLSGYSKGLKKGSIVRPGQPIGSVGSTGYGPPGTAGKFAPHLHFGIYQFDGEKTYSFDPYPLLKKWERSDRRKQ